MFWKLPKSRQTYGLLWKDNLSPRAFKNGPIWSHWHRSNTSRYDYVNGSNKDTHLARHGGLVVRMLSFKSYVLHSNPADVYSFFLWKMVSSLDWGVASLWFDSTLGLQWNWWHHFPFLPCVKRTLSVAASCISCLDFTIQENVKAIESQAVKQVTICTVILP